MKTFLATSIIISLFALTSGCAHNGGSLEQGDVSTLPSDDANVTVTAPSSVMLPGLTANSDSGSSQSPISDSGSSAASSTSVVTASASASASASATPSTIQNPTASPAPDSAAPTLATATEPASTRTPAQSTSGPVAALSGESMDLDGRLNLYDLEVNENSTAILRMWSSESGKNGTFEITQYLKLIPADSRAYAALDKTCKHKEAVTNYSNLVEYEMLSNPTAGGNENAVAVFMDVKNNIIVEVHIKGSNHKTNIKEISCAAGDR